MPATSQEQPMHSGQLKMLTDRCLRDSRMRKLLTGMPTAEPIGRTRSIALGPCRITSCLSAAVLIVGNILLQADISIKKVSLSTLHINVIHSVRILVLISTSGLHLD